MATPQQKPGFKPWRMFAAVSAGVILGFAGIGVYAWHEFADVDLGPNGYLAFTLGAVGTALLTIGLMMLLFFSAHRGYDEDIGRLGKDGGF